MKARNAHRVGPIVSIDPTRTMLPSLSRGRIAVELDRREFWRIPLQLFSRKGTTPTSTAPISVQQCRLVVLPPCAPCSKAAENNTPRRTGANTLRLKESMDRRNSGESHYKEEFWRIPVREGILANPTTVLFAAEDDEAHIVGLSGAFDEAFYIGDYMIANFG